MPAKETFRRLVADYIRKPVISIDLVSDNHSTAVRAFVEGEPQPLYFLCVDRPPIGPRRPLLTEIVLEEVEFTSWPPTRTRGGGSLLMGIG